MTDDTLHLLKEAQALFQHGNLRDAIQLLQRASGESPENVHALLLLGACHGRLGEPSKAAACFRKVLALDSQSPSAHFNLAIALGELGDPDGAATECRRALELRPDYFQAHHALGSFCVQLGKLEQATASFKAALSINPNAKVTHLELGSALSQLHRLDESLHAYDTAIVLDPDFVEAYEDRGSVLRSMGRFQESQRSFEKALKINPHSVRSLFNLGRFENAAESAKNGILATATVSRNNSRQRSLYQVFTDSMITLKRHTEAASFLESEIENHVDETTLYVLLGRVYLEMGNTQRASTCFLEAHRLDPNDRLTNCYLAQLGEGDRSENDIRDYVKDLFDDYAARFDEDLLENLGYKVPWLINDAFRRHDFPGDTKLAILDLGCGTGLCGPLFSDVKERLVGIDLSPEMIQEAYKLAVYDDLIAGDVVEEMRGLEPPFDLVIAADTLVYIRDLAPTFSAVNRLLGAGGLFVFSIEVATKDDFSVRASIRVAHSAEYIRDLATREFFEELESADAVLRYDGGQPIHGRIVTLRKPSREI